MRINVNRKLRFIQFKVFHFKSKNKLESRVINTLICLNKTGEMR